MSNRENAYTEVYTILQDLDDEEYEKIPPEVIEALDKNRNKDYEFELDDELELKEHELLPETKAILFNLFRDYLSTPEQKEKIIKMQKEEREKLELEKKQKYSTQLFNKKEEPLKNNIIEETKDIVVYKNIKWYQKIFSFIKKILLGQ